MSNQTMNYCEVSNLAYRSGSSDKVYHVEICKVNLNNGWTVNFKYGRRGSNLVEGTKTPSPVSYGTAKRIYVKLVDSKLKKGYYSTGGYSVGMSDTYKKLLEKFAAELNANQIITDEQVNSLKALLMSNNYESEKLAEQIIETKSQSIKLTV